MRKLKLQMRVSIDGMVAAREGHAHFNWDEEVRQHSIGNSANVDCILLVRKTATGFIPHWRSAGGFGTAR
jgi:hypothetical protein